MESQKQATDALIKDLLSRDLVGEVTQKTNAFKAEFDKVQALLVAKIALAFGNGFKDPDQYKNQAREATSEEAGQALVGKKRIMILTGAGISAASGIPTFRGQDGFWKQRKEYGGCADPETILTYNFFR
jgi:Sir2 family